MLEELHRELGADSDEGDTGLGDFGDHLVPRLVERGRTFVHRHEGYWRDLGQPHHYLRAHQDVLTDDVGVLSVPGWPVLSRLPQRVPARVLEGGEVVDSLLSPGARVAGRVVRSVLGPGVVVEPGRRGARQRGLHRLRRTRGRHRALVGRGHGLRDRGRTRGSAIRALRPSTTRTRSSLSGGDARWWAPTPRGAGWSPAPRDPADPADRHRDPRR